MCCLPGFKWQSSIKKTHTTQVSTLGIHSVSLIVADIKLATLSYMYQPLIRMNIAHSLFSPA